MDPSRRQVAHRKLAQLLREPLARLAEDTRLHWIGRYDVDIARHLLEQFGVVVPEERLRTLERVRDLLDAVAEPPARPSVPQPAWQSAASAALRATLERTSQAPPAVPGEAQAAAAGAPEGTFVSPTGYELERIGAAAVSCSDGRLGEQTDEFLHHGLGLPRYDRVACPGGPVALAGRLLAFWECRGVEDQLRLLVRLHRLRRVVLIGHDDCGYYKHRLGIEPERLEAEQRLDLERAAAAVLGMDPELAVDAYYARREAGRVRFEPVPLPGAPRLKSH